VASLLRKVISELDVLIIGIASIVAMQMAANLARHGTR
jgi:hypothetical protein